MQSQRWDDRPHCPPSDFNWYCHMLYLWKDEVIQNYAVMLPDRTYTLEHVEATAARYYSVSESLTPRVAKYKPWSRSSACFESFLKGLFEEIFGTELTISVR